MQREGEDVSVLLREEEDETTPLASAGSLTLASLSHRKAMISVKDIKPVGGPLRPPGPPPAPVAAAMRASRVADRAWEAAGTCHCSQSSQQAQWPWRRVITGN